MSLSISIFEKENRKAIEMYRLGRSGEYKGLFKKYCSIHGIRLEQIVLKTL